MDGVPNDEVGRELAGRRAGGVAFGLLVVLGPTPTPLATRAGADSFAVAGVAAGTAVETAVRVDEAVVPPPRVALRRGFRGGGAAEAIRIVRSAFYKSIG